MESIAGRVAFITDGSRGIGAAVSRSLAQAGARVVVASRSGDDLGLEAVLFVVTRPRTHRFLDVAFRPVTEASWG